MTARRLNFGTRIANLHDPDSRPVVFLGSSSNRLAITLTARGVGTLALMPAGLRSEGSMMVVAFAANVPFAAISRANVAVRKISPGRQPELAGMGLPRHLQFDEASRSLSFGVSTRLALTADEALVLTIDGFAPPASYSHVPMIMTVAWRNLYQIIGREVEMVRLHDGQALTLEPQHPARARGRTSPVS